MGSSNFLMASMADEVGCRLHASSLPFSFCCRIEEPKMSVASSEQDDQPVQGKLSKS